MKTYRARVTLTLVLAIHAARDTTLAAEDACGLQPWEAVVQDWATADRGNGSRHGRIMSLPPTQGYYVTDRIDLVPPPPPPAGLQRRGPYPAPGPHGGYPRPHSPSPVPLSYDEWQATPPPPPGPSKIVNRPPNPYKDQFKPSYAPPSPPPAASAAERVDAAPPARQVSETDVYLLRAIEKLVYRADLMEKRLRKLEESLLYVVGGKEPEPEPCSTNFTRIGGGCYHISTEKANWKGASFACRKLDANLLELDEDEKRNFGAGLLADERYRGLDLWTGGLNPGLLWIWAHSAKPVANATSDIPGAGRCLALTAVSGPPARPHSYRGQDCALRHPYVCERDARTDRLGNHIERVARELRQRRGDGPVLLPARP